MEATDIIVTQGDTLAGDIRDAVLDRIRGLKKPWTDLAEHEQRAVIFDMERVSRELVRGAVRLVADRGFPHIIVTTGKWTVKDGIKLEVSANGDVESITKLAGHSGSGAVLVLADAQVFMGEAAPAAFDRDQPDLPIGGERQVRVDAEQGIVDAETGEVLATFDELREAVEGEEAPLAGITIDVSQFPEADRAELAERARAKGATIIVSGADAGESGEHVEAPAAEAEEKPKGRRGRRVIADAEAA